jgi:hypothetical protein
MAILKSGWGYWDVSKYPYGGHFGRASKDTQCETIDGPVKYPDEKRVKLNDGRELVCKSAALQT